MFIDRLPWPGMRFHINYLQYHRPGLQKTKDSPLYIIITKWEKSDYRLTQDTGEHSLEERNFFIEEKSLWK